MLSLMATKMPPLVGRKIEDFSAPFRTTRCWRRADKRPVIHTVLQELRDLQMDETDASKTPDASQDVRESFIPVRLELRHLRSFVQVALDGSFGLAAEQIGITQPALSRQMKDLEFDVGAPLFERGTRGVALTAAGGVFLGDVKSVLSVVDHLPNEVRRAERAAEQRCVIGAVPHPWVDRIMVTAIADLESRKARVRVGLRAASTPLLPAALRAAEVDVGIAHLMPGPDTTPGFIRERLFHDEVRGVLLAPNHPLANESSLFLKDLENLAFVFPARAFFPAMYDAVWRQFQLAAFHPRVEGEYEGLQTMWGVVSQGLGWTLAWRGLMDEPPEGLKALKLNDFQLPWGAEIMYRQDESRAPILAAIDAIRDCASRMFTVLPFTQRGLPTPPAFPKVESDTRKAAIS
jgi:DNA-binding transcriptional LysR family regulator